MKPGIYIRVNSTREGEGEGEGTSLGTQKEACRRLAQSKAFPPVLAEDVISDRGSGVDPDRTGLLELGRRIADGRYTDLILYSPDRLARDPMTLIDFLNRCEEAGVRVHFVEGHPGSLDLGKLRRELMGFVCRSKRR